MKEHISYCGNCNKIFASDTDMSVIEKCPNCNQFLYAIDEDVETWKQRSPEQRAQAKRYFKNFYLSQNMPKASPQVIDDEDEYERPSSKEPSKEESLNYAEPEKTSLPKNSLIRENHKSLSAIKNNLKTRKVATGLIIATSVVVLAIVCCFVFKLIKKNVTKEDTEPTVSISEYSQASTESNQRPDESEPVEEESKTKPNEIEVTVTSKSVLPEDVNEGRYSPRVRLSMKVTNKTDKTVKGVKGILTIYDLFGAEICRMQSDFTGKDIPPNKYVTFDDYRFDVNEFLDTDMKIYNTDFADLKFEYSVDNIVYSDGSSIIEIESKGKSNDDVIVTVTDKVNYQADYNVGRYSPFVEFRFSIKNNTTQSIRGVQGVLDIQDLFGETIKKLNCDFTGQTIAPGQSVSFDDLGFDVNEFVNEDTKIWNEDFEDLRFEYEVTQIVN